MPRRAMCGVISNLRDLVSVGFMVVAAIRVQVLRAPQWLPALAADRRDSLDQRDELADIVALPPVVIVASRMPMVGNVLRCGTTLRSMLARLSTTGAGGLRTHPSSRLSLLRISAWMAAEGSWTSGAVPASLPYDWPACSRTPSAWIPIRR